MNIRTVGQREPRTHPSCHPGTPAVKPHSQWFLEPHHQEQPSHPKWKEKSTHKCTFCFDSRWPSGMVCVKPRVWPAALPTLSPTRTASPSPIRSQCLPWAPLSPRGGARGSPSVPQSWRTQQERCLVPRAQASPQLLDLQTPQPQQQVQLTPQPPSDWGQCFQATGPY